MLETYLQILDEGFYEAKFAFDGLADEHVWKRPADGLLSIGEMAGHVAYWEAIRLAREDEGPVRLAEENQEAATDAANCLVKSLLIDPRFRYLTATLETTPSAEHLAMTAEQVCSELLRVHNEAAAHFRTKNPDLDSTPPGWPAGHTYRAIISYLVIHVPYHVGQMYTVRHLLGEETPDN